jgi:small subunit ribosomal protein S10
MPQYARIKLTSANLPELERVAKEIREIADKTGVRVKGPQPLPTKRLKVTTRKAPTGEGTHTFDHWQLRIHRRILDIEPDGRTLRQITKLEIPEDVVIEVILTT